MNQVARQVTLFRHLVLDPLMAMRIVMALWLAVIAATRTGWAAVGSSVLLFAWLLMILPDWHRYHALGLSRSYWRGHRTLLATGLAALILLEAALLAIVTSRPVATVMLLSVAAAWLITVGNITQPRSRAQPPRSFTHDRTAATRRWWPMDPATQIIRAPQIATWLTIWAGLIVGLLLSAVAQWLFDLQISLAITLNFVLVVNLWLVTGTIGRSFREWISVGGTRSQWARQTALIGLLNPLCTLPVVTVAALLSEQSAGELIAVTVTATLLITIIVTLLELSNRRHTWWASLPYLAAAAALIYLWTSRDLSPWALLAAGGVLYAIHSVTLPNITHRATAFDGGISAWLGLTPTDAR